MCRASCEGGRRCTGKSSGAAAARQRQRVSRARRGLDAAYQAGDQDTIAAARAKYEDVTGNPAPHQGELHTTANHPDHADTATTSTTAAPAAPSAGSTDQRIRDAVRELAGTSGWAGLADVRKALGDVDPGEVTRVLRDMQRDDPNVHVAPESNRKVLTDEDHAAAVQVGGLDQHLICITPPRDDAAPDRLRAVGMRNATDAELEAARLIPTISSDFYDEIRAEQRRRQGK
ncbi:hypothetical protein [Amycolatopsis sp. CA-230715]|uniref:hypothetical protein n=1 Tax=Amycolatopsis sp. CA-230715 TaxID=2745196 RepID=UPI001C0258A7|nr:hypothetical protein [Amycolatopsis sp. CA-230715]QWF80461.1 hypothetical protein HUW46_03883 [Amycolatopsis sp. CA-230715]